MTTIKTLKSLIAGVAVLFLCEAASADIVFQQIPNQSGGGISDTDAYYFGQEHYWERIADDFQLQEDATLTNLVFFGFYYDAYYAPSTETMRVRILAARPSDSLPDESAVLYAQTIKNPNREATGLQIIGGPNPPEYKYTIDLEAPFIVSANTMYWLEIVQIGDPDSDFAWEAARTTSSQDVIAFNNAFRPNWDYLGPRLSQAFQLITPEPGAAGLLAFGLLVFCRRRPQREHRARTR